MFFFQTNHGDVSANLNNIFFSHHSSFIMARVQDSNIPIRSILMLREFRRKLFPKGEFLKELYVWSLWFWVPLFYLLLFPKGEFLKELYEGSLWFWVPLFYLLLFGFHFDPLRPVPLIVVGVWVAPIFAPVYLIFWLMNKQNVLISNMFCILLYGLYIKRYDFFLPHFYKFTPVIL